MTENEPNDEPQPMTTFEDWNRWREDANREIFAATLAQVYKLLREMLGPQETRH